LLSGSPVTLGIHDGHNGTAALVVGGTIVGALSEERVTRLKNEPGYPEHAVEELLTEAGIGPGDIDKVSVASLFGHPPDFFSNYDWYRNGYRQQLSDRQTASERSSYYLNKRAQERTEAVVAHLGIDKAKMHFVEHHHAHASAAYFGSRWAQDSSPVLVFTLDGSGDGLCATVSIGENGRLERVAATKSDASLGKIYSRLTFLLGMKPIEHEYKVMGLAPYADQDGVERSFNVLSSLLRVDSKSLEFRRKSKLSTNYCYPYLKRNLENHRFDWIAGAAQRLVEELTTEWVLAGVRRFGIKRIALGGGVFMNVKLNMKIAQLPEIDELFISPSCGDESLAMGGAFDSYAEYMHRTGQPLGIAPLGTLYLDREFGNQEIEQAISSHPQRAKWEVQRCVDITSQTALELSEGWIVARFAGKGEWGARSLGNRSILADPRRPELSQELNAAIKQRDFWMPFAPTILSDDQEILVENPKNIAAPYMMLALPTTSEGQRALQAATHTYDHTVRPQILEKTANPEYYRLIAEFKRHSGIGGVLNTSFNIHGEPIVRTPEDALHTLVDSGLQKLAIGDYMISKQSS
jgi:carbamoyltransferase